MSTVVVNNTIVIMSNTSVEEGIIPKKKQMIYSAIVWITQIVGMNFNSHCEFFKNIFSGGPDGSQSRFFAQLWECTVGFKVVLLIYVEDVSIKIAFFADNGFL